MTQVDFLRWNAVNDECALHIERLKHALKRVEHLLPLSIDTEKYLTEDEIAFFDQLIYRYLKLQDTMGEKQFPLALKLLGEDYSSKPFIDVLNRLERLELIPSRDEWVFRRELGNDLTHEYPEHTEDRIHAINKLADIVSELAGIHTHIKKYVESHAVYE
jgi:hypothetical protein